MFAGVNERLRALGQIRDINRKIIVQGNTTILLEHFFSGTLHLTKETSSFSMLPKSGREIIFFKNLASSVTRCHGQLLSFTISEKTNDPILRKLSDGRTGGRTDRRTRVITVLN